MANQLLARQEDLPSHQPKPGNNQSISGLSASNNSNLLAGQFRDIYIGESKSLNDVLKSLPTAADAPFNSYHRQHESACLPDTRVDLLQEIYDWADGTDERCIFWLNGLAGTGKSTIARTVARRYYKQKRLGASFFFSRGGEDVSHAGKFFTSLAVQLAKTIPSLQNHICDTIVGQSDIASLSLSDQWCQLVLGPLSRLEKSHQPYVLVIDALDECDSDINVRTILGLLAEVQLLKTVRLRVFLTGRPEIPIRHGIHLIPQAQRQYFILHDISQTIVDHDINIFFRHRLKHIADEHCLGAGWPDAQFVKHLVQSASGLFIWAATACRFIEEGRSLATNRLSIVLKVDSIDDFADGFSSDDSITDANHNDHAVAPDQHLDKLYITVIRNSIYKYKNPERKKWRKLLGSIIVTIAVLSSPLSTQSLAKVLGTTQDQIDQILNDLHAILDIPKDTTHPLRLHHPSFRDFLLDPERCKDLRLGIGEKQAHQALVTKCIRLMSCLKKDVCGQEAPGALIADLESCRIEQCLPLEVRYACLYWVQHLQSSDSHAYDNKEAYQFLQAHLLHWLEALGWMGKITEGIQEILSLEAYISATKSPGLYAFIHDAKRFALYNRSVIEQVPLQLYCSALVFAPERSIVRKAFEIYIPSWIERKTKVQEHWNAALQTLEGHSDSVTSVAFSPDGKQIVSGSNDKTIRLWDAATGASLQTLKGHSSTITSVAFSPNNKQVMSGSYNKIIQLWDITTGVLLQTLKGHSDSVTSVAFSPDGKQIVSGSSDNRIRLWDTTGASLQMLEGHSDWVTSVAFSPNSKQIVSGSDDKTIQLWDAATGASLQTLEGHSGSVTSVAFSPNGKQIVSGSDNKTIQLWDAATGALLQMLKGHSDWVTSVAFSPNSKQIVSGSDDKTIQLWDAATGASLQTLEGHSGSVTSVAFSPDGKQVMSGSDNKTIQLWDAVTGASLQMLEGHSDSVTSVAFSPDGKQIVSGSNDKTIRLWDAAKGASLQTLKGHSNLVTSIAFSPNSKQIVSGSDDMIIQLWDTATGALLQTFKGHSNSITSVAFSPNSKQVISGSDDKTIRLWDTATGALLETLKGHLGTVTLVAFSPNSKQIVSGSYDKTVRLWDAVTKVLLQIFKGHSSLVTSVAFSPNNKQVVSGSHDKTIQLWDTTTGVLLQTLKGHSGSVTSVAFSPNSKQIVSGSDDKTIRLWDAATGASLQTLKGHSDTVASVAFSPDGKLQPTILVLNDWVVESDMNIIWLPPDYRQLCSATWNRTLVIGHSSGRISLLSFKKAKLII